MIARAIARMIRKVLAELAQEPPQVISVTGGKFEREESGPDEVFGFGRVRPS